MKYIWGIGINKEIILNIAAETPFLNSSILVARWFIII